MTTPQADSEGWIEHDGGEDIPVDADACIEYLNNRYKVQNCDLAGCITGENIARYRLLVPKHELDKALARIAELEDHLKNYT